MLPAAFIVILSLILSVRLAKMDYYGAISSGYDELHREEQLAKYNIVKSVLKPKKSCTLLDVACGTGIGRVFGCKVTGVDSSAGILKRCSGIKKVLAPAEKLPFPDKSFDVVTCITAIHNFNDIKQAVSEMKRVSKGIVVISVLKKSARRDSIVRLLRRSFAVGRVVDEDRDTVLFLHNKI